jgi:ABC-type siderophore export system fused ATPase/permease subunit
MVERLKKVRMITFKIMFDRVRNYISIIQFAMIGYLFIIGTDFNLVSTLFVVAVASTILAVVDFKWIYPAEMERATEKNPVFMELRSNQREMLSEMKELRKKLGRKYHS